MLKKVDNEELSIKVYRELLKNLREGYFNDTGRLPPEEVIAKEMGISRGVLRDVLATLESEGYISRRRGVGTIVNKHIIQSKTRLDAEKDFFDMIAEDGYSARAEYTKGSWIKADDESSLKLDIEKGSNIMKVEKLFSANDTPAIYVVDHIPEVILTNKRFSKDEYETPIFRLIKKKSGLVAETVLVEVDASPISDEIARELKLEPGATLLRASELAYTFDFKPILWSSVYYRPGFFKMTLLRKNYMR